MQHAGEAINIPEQSEGTMAEASGGEGRIRGAVLSRRRKRRLRTQPVIDAEARQAKLGSLSDVRKPSRWQDPTG